MIPAEQIFQCASHAILEIYANKELPREEALIFERKVLPPSIQAAREAFLPRED